MADWVAPATDHFGPASQVTVRALEIGKIDTARSLYSRAVMNHPNRLVMLCDRARVLARIDQPETMPI